MALPPSTPILQKLRGVIARAQVTTRMAGSCGWHGPEQECWDPEVT